MKLAGMNQCRMANIDIIADYGWEESAVDMNAAVILILVPSPMVM